MNYAYMESPVGRLIVVADDTDLRIISFENARYGCEPDPGWTQASNSILTLAQMQLAEYFAGVRKEFDVPLAPTGTEFQLLVWSSLISVPFGKTASYRDVAKRIGRPNALRAVGSANGRNPLPIMIPCHRIVGSRGDLVGFGGGLAVKQWLLAHEANTAQAKHNDS